jgi:hypothetical protein
MQPASHTPTHLLGAHLGDDDAVPSVLDDLAQYRQDSESPFPAFQDEKSAGTLRLYIFYSSVVVSRLAPACVSRCFNRSGGVLQLSFINEMLAD